MKKLQKRIILNIYIRKHIGSNESILDIRLKNEKKKIELELIWYIMKSSWNRTRNSC